MSTIGDRIKRYKAVRAKEATSEDYYSEDRSLITHVWVSPNSGPGNPRSRPISENI
jgi:hypothetical protein